MKLFKTSLLLLSVFMLFACAGKNTSSPTDGTVTQASTTKSGEAGDADDTYGKTDILQAASDFFGTGSAGLAKIIEKSFAEKGRPIGYIKGTEGGGAFIIGARWGKGILSHRIEGDSKIYWRGPSLGVDFGGNVSKVFALVYDLHDVEEIYGRFPSVEGSLYFVGGLGFNYMNKNEITIAPIRTGVGLRAGASLGYLHFSKKSSILPF